MAAVERKSLADLVATMTSGKARYLLADLATLPNAAVVVEDRYSSVFKLRYVRPSVIADGLGEAAARFAAVPIVFAETRPLAQEWTYRFLGAAVAHHLDDRSAATLAGVADARRAGCSTHPDHGRRQGMGPPPWTGCASAWAPPPRDLGCPRRGDRARFGRDGGRRKRGGAGTVFEPCPRVADGLGEASLRGA